MNIYLLWKFWKSFWFSPESPVPCAMARILFGCLIMQFAVMLSPELHELLGEKSILPARPQNDWWGTPAWSLLNYLPASNAVLDWLLWLLMICALFLAAGLWTRFSAFVIWLIMISFYARNPFVFGASDSILRTVAFLFVFSHAGDALSIKRIADVWLSGKCPTGPPQSRRPWAFRLIQVHFALVWWVAFARKTQGAEWVNGTAVYYARHNSELARYPLPFVPDNLWTSRLLSWTTMVSELSLATLIWVKQFRLGLICLGTILHLTMDWALWVPQFEFVMIAGLLTFIEPQTYRKFMASVRRIVRQLGAEPVLVAYDPASDLSCRLAETAARLDVLQLIERQVYPAAPGEAGQFNESHAGLTCISGARHFTGIAAARVLALRLPVLMLFYPFLFLPAAPMLARSFMCLLANIYKR